MQYSETFTYYASIMPSIILWPMMIIFDAGLLTKSNYAQELTVLLEYFRGS